MQQIEAEISLLEDEDRAEFLEAMGMEEPGLNVVIRAGYKLLGLQTYFTAGVQEVRAWTVKLVQRLLKQLVLFILISKKALSVLKLLHMMTSYNTTVKNGAKEAGKWRLEGKTYVVQDGDVMHFRFNV